MKVRTPQCCGMLVLLLAWAPTVPAQCPPASGSLEVTAVEGEAKTITVDGKLYVDVAMISQLLGATWEMKDGRAVLSLPVSSRSPEPEGEPLSRAFISAGIDLGTTIREWRFRLIDATVHSYPFLEDLAASYQRKADTQLATAGSAVTTSGDRHSLDLLTSDVNLMRRFSAKYVERRRSSTGVFPEEIENDVVGLQVLECVKGLANFSITHEYQDVIACHE